MVMFNSFISHLYFRSLLCYLLIYSFQNYSIAQDLATITIQSPTDISVPVSVVLDDITFKSDSELSLWKKTEGKEMEVPFQITGSSPRMLKWINTGTNNNYVLKAQQPSFLSDSLKAKRSFGLLSVSKNNQIILGYQYGTLYPPQGVNLAYKRSGFIHPLNTPNGQVLTRIQPKDHYHHYGIWNPWTHVEYKGDTLDFWNLAKSQGTVQFDKFLHENSGPVQYDFTVLHHHIILKPDPVIPLIETQKISIIQPESSEGYFVDFLIEYQVQGESPVNLLEYRYGGFGWRTTEYWNNQNSQVITSEGLDRKQADGSLARWCIVQGELPDSEYGGVVMMSYPTNYNHPEPLRIWPYDMYGRGDMFANFDPTKNKDWKLMPGKTYHLHYRLYVYNGKLTPETAENLWKVYTNDLEINVTKN